jgi:hypothetical protein
VICNDIAGDYEHKDDEEVRMYQMPLTGENFKQDNKLVYAMLKSAGVKTDAWTWIQDHDKCANGVQCLDVVDLDIMMGRVNSTNVSKRSKEEI